MTTQPNEIEICAAYCEGADQNIPLPSYETNGSACCDVRANFGNSDRATGKLINPGKSKLIECGICLSLPQGFEIQVRPRSGLAFKHSITVLNSPGTIDSDYRGEIKVLLINHGEETFRVNHGDRIAQ